MEAPEVIILDIYNIYVTKYCKKNCYLHKTKQNDHPTKILGEHFSIQCCAHQYYFQVRSEIKKNLMSKINFKL